jgi:hypothetical protein
MKCFNVTTFCKIAFTATQQLIASCRTPCGFADIEDVQLGLKADRMESFFLSETLKYFYLLFDVHHESKFNSMNWIYTTEAHPLPITHDTVTSYKRLYTRSRQVRKVKQKPSYVATGSQCPSMPTILDAVRLSPGGTCRYDLWRRAKNWRLMPDSDGFRLH